MRRRLVLAATALAYLAGSAPAAPSATEAARIESLIQYVEAQHKARFVRNGISYTCQEAGLFLRAKLDKMGEQVNTAAQFVDEIASRSSTSGQAYWIRFPDGRSVTAAQFLGEELRRIDGRR